MGTGMGRDSRRCHAGGTEQVPGTFDEPFALRSLAPAGVGDARTEKDSDGRGAERRDVGFPFTRPEGRRGRGIPRRTARLARFHAVSGRPLGVPRQGVEHIGGRQAERIASLDQRDDHQRPSWLTALHATRANWDSLLFEIQRVERFEFLDDEQAVAADQLAVEIDFAAAVGLVL